MIPTIKVAYDLHTLTDRLNLMSVHDYIYLQQSNCFTIHTVNDMSFYFYRNMDIYKSSLIVRLELELYLHIRRVKALQTCVQLISLICSHCLLFWFWQNWMLGAQITNICDDIGVKQ